MNTNDRGNWTDRPCYYVDARDAGRFVWLAGPFAHQRQAAAAVDIIRHAAIQRDPKAHFYQFGTCRVKSGHRDGTLNTLVGFDDMPHKPRQPVHNPNAYRF